MFSFQHHVQESDTFRPSTLQNSAILMKLYLKLSRIHYVSAVLLRVQLYNTRTSPATSYKWQYTIYSQKSSSPLVPFSWLSRSFFPTTPPVRVKVFNLLVRIPEFLHSIFSPECSCLPKRSSSTYSAWISLFLDYCTFSEIRSQMELITKLC